jgi:hypothetical protein
MTVGLAGAALHVLVGFVIGATTAFYGGKLDTLVQRVVDGINWTGWAGAWQWTKYVWIDAAMKQAMGH